tara:strand:+ start:2180 stop:2980 length:801 start_codon:yes stop_codon:yes gene_type:complete
MDWRWAISTEYLYKYRSVSNEEFLRQIFVEHKLYFSRVSDFNDPFDCKFRSSFEATEREKASYSKRLARQYDGHLPRALRRQKESVYRKSLAGNVQSLAHELERKWLDIRNNLGICSFSKVRDEILMWSHYADSHKGICIEFIDDPTDKFMARAQPVIYSKDYPVINRLKDSNDECLKKALLTKSDRWSYEEEYRAIYNPEDQVTKGFGIKIFPECVMTGVIFGCNAEDATIEKVKSFCVQGGLSLKFYQASIDRSSYSLNIAEIP